MDAYECIITKLDVREFAKKRVPGEIRKKILEAARATGSSMNSQHWRFILIQDRDSLAKLAADSSSGGWVAGADFGVVILSNPKVPGYRVDAGRALQDMEVAAWNFGVASGMYTGFKLADLHRDFFIPEELEVSAGVGFGYPARTLSGKKDRKPLEQLVYSEKYGQPIDEQSF